jgi:glutaryl-CoA dehydrogenase
MAELAALIGLTAFRLEDQLTERTHDPRHCQRAFAQSELQPRVIEAYRTECVDAPELFPLME